MHIKQNLCKKLYSRPRVLLTIIVGITLFFILQLPRLRFDNNNFRFVPENDPARLANAEIAAIFGDEVPLLIGIKREYGTIVEKDFLQKMKELDAQLSALPLVKRVVSLTTTSHIDSNGSSIVTGSLIPETLTGSTEERAAITEKLRSWDLYDRSLVSDDLKATQILIFLDIKQEESGLPETVETCRAVMNIAEKWDCPDAVTYVTGEPVFSEIVNEATAHDLAFLVPLVILAVVGVLFLSFKRFTGVILPLLTVLISCLWALGAMALFSVPLSILSTVLPVILIAVGSAYGIHVSTHYFNEVVQDTGISREQHTGQVITVMTRIIPPVFLASLTTCAGFVSFCFTPVTPIFEFGIFSAFGVIAAFTVSITLIPAILIIRGPKPPMLRRRNAPQPRTQKKSLFDMMIADTLMVFYNHRRTVLLIAAACFVFSGYGISKLIIDNVLMEYFEPDVQIVKSDVFIQKNFGGSKLLNLFITSDEPNAVIRPDVLQAIDSLARYAEANIPEVGKITSIADLIKRLNQVYNADSPASGIQTDSAAGNDSSGAVNTAEILRVKIYPPETPDDSFSPFGDFGFSDDAETTDTSGADFSSNTSGAASPSTADNTRPSVPEPQYTFPQIVKLLSEAQAHYTGVNITTEDILSVLQKEINYKGKAYYEIPSDPKKYGKTTQAELTALIQNYLLLLAGNTQGLIDDIYTPRALKINIQLRTVGQKDSDKAVSAIMNYIASTFPKDIQVKKSGTILIEESLNRLVVESQLISLAVSLAIVFLILTAYYRSPAAGIIGIVPLLISIALNFGIMGIMGIKLNIGTAMVASFAIGIGIDYTIHYLAAYRHEYTHRKEHGDFLIHTFYGSGKAIFFNALSVGAGFAVLMLSKFNMLSDLGFLIALIMLTSSFASLTVLPTLLSIIKPRFITKEQTEDSV